ncbi:hypothetical protein [Endozoicomonas arenosclerae]|uniref:hypothetical protein n=1 Tax=Endozoicomonas arenosclerae TaxID=1633495 RepID=UPI0007819C09|nr:hypothetical protein [Endozoicomonas arenosclerae]
MKGRFGKNLRNELRKWIKPVLIVSLIFLLDELSKEYISKKNEIEIVGCIRSSTAKTGKSGIYGIVVESQGKEETLATYDKLLAKKMKNNVGECFHFTVFRHSFWIPNIGTTWIVTAK